MIPWLKKTADADTQVEQLQVEQTRLQWRCIHMKIMEPMPGCCFAAAAAAAAAEHSTPTNGHKME